MKKINLVIVLSMLAAASSASAETYQCAQHRVVTDADSGVLLDGYQMKRVGQETYVLGQYELKFSEYYNSNREVLTQVTLSAGQVTVLCK